MNTKVTKKIIQNGQAVTIEYEIEEEQVNHKQKDDGFMDKLFESTRVTNEFSHAVRQALMNESETEFKKLYEDYKKHSQKERLDDGQDEEKEENQKISIIKIIAADFVAFTYDKEFKSSMALSYLNTLKEVISPKILTFLLAATGQKEAVYSILEKNNIELNEEKYDIFYEVLRVEVYMASRDKPYSSTEAKELYNARKKDFFSTKNMLDLSRELNEKSLEENQSKRPKL